MIRRPPRSTQGVSSAASDVYKRQVKGHATEEMVEKGEVRREDKEGNDYADEAAEEGATTSQGRVRKFAEIYSWRHMMYRKLMAGIQKYIVELTKEEKKLKQDDAKQSDPFGKREANKARIWRQLNYVNEEEEVESMRMHMIKKEWCHDEVEWAYTKGVQAVLAQLEWRKENTTQREA